MDPGALQPVSRRDEGAKDYSLPLYRIVRHQILTSLVTVRVNCICYCVIFPLYMILPFKMFHISNGCLMGTGALVYGRG
jgi:hypothetical protein